MGVKIGLPFRPTGIKRPIDLWLGAADEDLADPRPPPDSS